uniref:Myb-like domain-containing protein n=1 Tax=Noccaea caerulescens TaxID=107243 RepID=A0A1J3HZY6_NOCCA
MEWTMEMSIVPKETIGAGAALMLAPDAEYGVRQMMQDLDVEMVSFTHNERDSESVEALLAMKEIIDRTAIVSDQELHGEFDSYSSEGDNDQVGMDSDKSRCENLPLALEDTDHVTQIQNPTRKDEIMPTMRILWSPEEVEMLKVCVEKFAPKVKRNLPWQKILLMGKDVFHESRTPSRLKDKWKTMKAKKKMLRWP